MVIVKLQGGLGNQMFQYAAGRSLLKKGEPVFLDHYFFYTVTLDEYHSVIREYELHIFENINVKKAADWHIRIFKSHSRIFAFIRKIFKSYLKFVEHPHTDYLPISELAGKDYVYLEGYFQSENYFANIRREILNEFQFPALDPVNEKLRQKIRQTVHSVSVHIRRGDYLKLKATLEVHGVLPLTYYTKALQILKNKYRFITLFVFSDDLNWAKQNFDPQGLDVNFIDQNYGRDSWKDMALMSNCKHHIVANSSFSWWAAWLSDNDGDVLAPINWFNEEKVKYAIHDIVPTNWIVVKYV